MSLFFGVGWYIGLIIRVRTRWVLNRAGRVRAIGRLP